MDMREELDSIYQKLRQERDELKLQAHLLRAEMRDEWREAESRFDGFKGKSEQVLKASEQAGEDVYEALKKTGKEVARGFKRIRDTL